MYNIMLWYVYVTNVAVKKQYVLNIMHVCVRIHPSYLAHKSHLPYRDAGKSLAWPTSRCILFDG
jgi:hypothetical protein